MGKINLTDKEQNQISGGNEFVLEEAKAQLNIAETLSLSQEEDTSGDSGTQRSLRKKLARKKKNRTN